MQVCVIGTGTDVGKTITSALIARRYGTSTNPVAYWKPVATGTRQGRDINTVEHLAGTHVRIVPTLYEYAPPVSPHLAASLAKRPILPQKIIQTWRTQYKHQTPFIIEGIGGLCVPLCQNGYLWADLLVKLELSVVLVALSTLGTINHTLLTLEAARSRGINVLGVVLNGPRNPHNAKAISKFGHVPILAQVPRFKNLSPLSIARYVKDFDLFA